VLRHDDVDSQQASAAAGPDGGSGHGGVTSDDRAQAGPGDDDSAWTPTVRRRTGDEFLYAMKEDLGDWLGALHGVDVGADEFFERLETGVLLCRHANAVHRRHDTDDLGKLLDRPLRDVALTRSPSLPSRRVLGIDTHMLCTGDSQLTGHIILRTLPSGKIAYAATAANHVTLYTFDLSSAQHEHASSKM